MKRSMLSGAKIACFEKETLSWPSWTSTHFRGSEHELNLLQEILRYHSPDKAFCEFVTGRAQGAPCRVPGARVFWLVEHKLV